MGNIFTKFFTYTVLLALPCSGWAQTLKLDGIYQGKNIFVYNPSVNKTPCVNSVKVNNTLVDVALQSNSFEINLAALELKQGDAVAIEISYKEGGNPRIANPDAIKIKSTYNLTTLKLDLKTSKITFTTTVESGALPFIVEQYRWGKWIKAGEVMGKGTSTTNSYQITVNVHSGENQYRVSQTDYSGTPKISKVFKFRSTSPAVSFSPLKKITNQIKFSDITMYEIYDSNGSIKLKGTANAVDISSLPKSDKTKYILLFDNQETEFVKE